MNSFMKIQQKIIPEATALLERRYSILRTIFNSQPIGRRTLSAKLELGERIVRGDLDFFKSMDLIEVSLPGVTLTEQGIEMLNSLRAFVSEVKGLEDIENLLKKELGYKKIIVVPGDSDKDPNVKRELGNAAAMCLSGMIRHKDIIALTGGSTIKEMVDSFPRMDFKDNLIVPARGSLGKIIDIQSNNLVAALAEKLGASYKLLNVPDNLSSQSLEVLLKEKEIREVVDLIKRAQILVLGIGRADKMAQRRGLSREEITELLEEGAVGEAFGTYFGKGGKIIRKINSVGIRLEDYNNVGTLIAVTGGSSKAEAIDAVRLGNENAILVTDEGAARKVMQILKSQYNEF